MKKISYTLKIENACHQDWEKMHANSIGKFCLECSKPVVDFTNLSDDEMIGLIENAKGNLCGRFNNDQLNRLLIQTKQQNANATLTKMLAALLLISSANYAAAQMPKEDKISVVDSSQKAISSTRNNSKIIVEGKIIDSQTGLPLSFATVCVKEIRQAVAADVNGNFKIVFRNSLAVNTLQVSSVGYQTQEFSLSGKKKIIIKLKKFEGTLTSGMVVVVATNDDK